MILNLKNPLVFFDIEATGTNIPKDHILEIALIKLLPNGDTEEKHHLLNPGSPIPPESSMIHGIYDKDVKDQPSFKEIAKNLAQFLEGSDLGGFSILNFDVPMLMEEFLRADIEFDISKKKIVDCQKIFHLMEKRNLSSAYRFYCDKDLKDAHSAMADTKASLEVLEQQVKRYEGQDVTDGLGKKVGEMKNEMGALHNITLSNKIDLAGRLVRGHNDKEVFNFGKYKGQPVEEVFKKEPQYYDWIMKGDFPLDTKRRVTEIKLRGFQK